MLLFAVGYCPLPERCKQEAMELWSPSDCQPCRDRRVMICMAPEASYRTPRTLQTRPCACSVQSRAKACAGSTPCCLRWEVKSSTDCKEGKALQEHWGRYSIRAHELSYNISLGVLLVGRCWLLDCVSPLANDSCDDRDLELYSQMIEVWICARLQIHVEFPPIALLHQASGCS